MTNETLTTADRARDELAARGYKIVDTAGALAVGDRIRHVGHQWPAALRDGTGVVHALARGGGDDVELIVVWDKPGPTGSQIAGLADYHVVATDGRDAPVPVRAREEQP